MATAPPVSDTRFDPNYPAPPKQGRSMWANCLIGCLAVAVVLAIIGIFVAWYISQHWRGALADVGAQGLKAMVDATDLAAPEQADIDVQIDRLAQAFREGKLPMDRLNIVMEELSNSPLITTFAVSAIGKKYIDPSGLTAEEKSAGKITLLRFIRGEIDKKIPQPDTDAAMMHVADRQGDGQWRLKQQVTDAELKAFLVAAKDAADKAGVAPEPPNFDPSDEFKRIVDKALSDAEAGPAVPDVPPIELPPAETPK